jgi:hypothetical protein
MWALWLLMSEAQADDHPHAVAPYGNANVFALAGLVEAGPAAGIAASADAGLSWILQLHVEVGASAGHSFLDAAPDGLLSVARLNVEVAYPASFREDGVIGPAIATDWRLPLGEECVLSGWCPLPTGAGALGFAWRRQAVSDKAAYVSGFGGAGFQGVTGDTLAPYIRIRMEWGRTNGTYYGFEITGPLEATAMFGVHL